MFIAIAINLLILYGFVTRPVIAYYLSTPLGYNETIDFSTQDILIELTAKNKGLAPVKIELTLMMYNSSIIYPEGLQSPTDSGVHSVKLSLDEPIRQSSNETYVLSLEPLGEPTYVAFVFSVDTIHRSDPFTGFYESFMVSKPERPTALLLKRFEGEAYMRTRKK
jgi:hypothetical protein